MRERTGSGKRAIFLLPLATILLLAAALIAVACGGGENGPDARQTPDQVEQGDGDDAASPTPTPVVVGSGTVTIGGETYEFSVQRCQLDADQINVDGQGLGPDGRPLAVRVTRRGEIDIIQVRLTEGLTVYLSGTGISDALGGEAPSLLVEGRSVTSSGTFYTTEEQARGADAVGEEGSLAVECQ